jgi:hypothetical protein
MSRKHRHQHYEGSRRQVSRRAKTHEKQGRSALLLLAASLIFLGVLLIGLVVTREPPSDPESGCPTGVIPTAHTVIIVDQSDSYSERQIDYARSIILGEYDRLRVGEKFTILGLSPDPDNPDRAFSKCRLKQGKDVLGITSNPRMINKRFEQIVGTELSAFIASLADAPQSETSPIFETITVILEAVDFSRGVQHRRLVVISDMVQHSDIASHYGRGKSSVQLPQAIQDRWNRSITGVVVRIHYVARNNLETIQTAEHQDFWKSELEKAGASDVKLSWGGELVDAPKELPGPWNTLKSRFFRMFMDH